VRRPACGRRRQRAGVALAVLGALLGIAAALGCVGVPAGSASRREPGLATVPAAVDVGVDPYAGSAVAAVAGRKLFLRHCADCHGGDARGGGRAPSLASERVAGASPGAVFWFMTNGNLRAGMPAWSRLPPARRWQLVAYLRTLGAPPR
jgi:mono/diheme cytochrome c family protein